MRYSFCAGVRLLRAAVRFMCFLIIRVSAEGRGGPAQEGGRSYRVCNLHSHFIIPDLGICSRTLLPSTLLGRFAIAVKLMTGSNAGEFREERQELAFL